VRGRPGEEPKESFFRGHGGGVLYDGTYLSSQTKILDQKGETHQQTQGEASEGGKKNSRRGNEGSNPQRYLKALQRITSCLG